MKITPLEPWIRNKISANCAQLTRPDLEAWQLQKLNDTLSWVRARSSFYGSVLAGLPSKLSQLGELQQFPLTTPDMIRQNPFQFVCVSQSDIQRVVTLQTSGTTGEPKRIYFTADDQELTIDFFGVGMSVLTAPGDSVLIFLPGATPGSVGDLLRLGLARMQRVPLPYGPIYDAQHALTAMQSQQPDCLVGIPTQVLGLARRWISGYKPPRTVLLSTDYVPASIVRFLENTWGCKVFNHYGTTEMGLGGGVECEAHRGSHLREADLYFEVLDPHTAQPISDGEYGEVVFSTLTRIGMPLIRYRTGDYSRFIPGPCPCGTTLRTLENISGRLDGFVTVGGRVLKLADFDEVLFPIPNLLNYSITLTGSEPKASVIIETQMFTGSDSSAAVKKALDQISSIDRLDVIVNSRFNPGEVGSLHKRSIIDLRGEYA